MAFALRALFLLCGICGLLSGAWSFPTKIRKAFNCPKDWTQLDHNCYIYQEEARGFADAEAVCQILGGNLVSIHSRLENAVVMQVAIAGGTGSEEIWIGFHDTLEDDDFIWTDGSRDDFTNFLTNEPNSANGDCIEAVLPDGGWQTEDCGDSEPYVCIMEAGH
ncbi:ladderlectin-like [Syngnathoides biaculeatus]|uniref:ladderlectin-like n=1 Tax=Syngnathoides biaculeatus TaxID=300417 RepID=UPI002ADE5C7C|nr:ladderlectin-like [Syngnathoides biaculeatus]XP_061678971.1 ladderlectin-like [Syngnathoides biaculeatus]